MDYGFMQTHNPVDVVARRVTSKGVDYEFDVNHIAYHSDVPLKLEKINNVMKNSKAFVDLTGIKYGRLTVIGMAKRNEKMSKRWACWLVRCSCGKYETRNTKSIKKNSCINDEHDIDMCHCCRDTRKLRLMAQAKSAGMSYVDYCEKMYPRDRIVFNSQKKEL